MTVIAEASLLRAGCGILAALLAIGSAVAQLNPDLQITEVLYNSVDETDWEWIEVRNTSVSPIDLDGYYFDDDDGLALSFANIVSTASGGNSTNTNVPAGGVAVFYNGNSLAFDDSRFRNAWNLDTGVSLIAVNDAPSLSNSGDAVGLWTESSYLNDTGDDGDGNIVVLGFGSAAATVDYSQMGFPTGVVDRSIQWSGNGNYMTGSQWASSVLGENGAVESVETTLSMTQINSTADTANPGLLPAGGAAAGLLISEIMYNPASAEGPTGAWEWIEVLNNTGANIDFAADPHVLDDDDGGPLLAENVTSGSVDDGSVAILFNADDVSLQNMQDAWGAGLNYIPVNDWQGLGNSGDLVAIWDDFNTYTADESAGTVDGAIASVDYTDDPPFPQDNGTSSIFLDPLTAVDPNDGNNWQLSTIGDPPLGDGISFNAMAVFDSQMDHSGGDIGSPGNFTPLTAGPVCDFDDSGTCEIADLDLMYAQLGTANPTFDLDGNGEVNNDDVTQWLAEASAVDPLGRTFLRGDTDLNGNVEGSDFTTLAVNFGDVGTWGAGNFVVDAVAGGGDVGGPDFTQLAVNFGFTSPVNSVPEPGTLPLLMVAVLGLVGMAGKRR